MISMFKCGCQLDGRYCPTHANARCHAPESDLFAAAYRSEKDDCPPCFLARLRSVSLSSAATPTRKP